MTRRIFVQTTGASGVHVLEADDQTVVGGLLDLAKATGLSNAESSHVFLEGEDDPLTVTAMLDDAGIVDNSSVHMGRCVHVAVTVRYGGRNITQNFSPARRVEQVFKWATGNQGFDVGHTDALDLALQVCGQQSTANPDDHIGSLVRGEQCALCFDLTPTDRIQG